MLITLSSRLAASSLIALLLAHAVALEQSAAAENEPFSSEEGRFSIQLPGEPQHDATAVGDAQEVQHQFQVAAEQGVYLVSYQDNPNLEGGTPEQLRAALSKGRDGMQQAFRGELLESKDIKLDDKHPGMSFRITIPQAGGEARCRFYMVGTRLYQILVLGTPDFVSTDEATGVLGSFKLLPDRPRP